MLWDIGKTSGIFCHGIEEEVIQEYMCMEERDMGLRNWPRRGIRMGCHDNYKSQHKRIGGRYQN